MESIERPATNLILNYRECARTIWNGYFRHFPDGWHEFINVEHELFVAMVLVQAFGGHGLHSPARHWIRVRPRSAPNGLRALVAREERRGYWDWKEHLLHDTTIELGFIEFFDWRSDGVRDLEFARARVERCSESPELVGADVLIPALDCEYVGKVGEPRSGT